MDLNSEGFDCSIFNLDVQYFVFLNVWCIYGAQYKHAFCNVNKSLLTLEI